MIDEYKIYLNVLNEKLAKFFAQQSPYIHCKEGCSYCCKNAQFPYSKIEFEYLMQGFGLLDDEKKQLILKRIEEIKQAQSEVEDQSEFTYDCPFLIDGRCCVYENRGIICRTFGLPYFTEDKHLKVPCCVHIGLNYSSVYDPDKKMFAMELFEKTGNTQEPLAYNLSLKYLLNNEVAKYLGLNFGEDKTLIDWFE